MYTITDFEKTLTNERFDEELEKEFKALEAYVSKDAEGIIPMITVKGFIGGESETFLKEGLLKTIIMPIVTTGGDAEDYARDKYKILRRAGQLLAEKEPNFYPLMVFFLSEVWIKSVDREEGEKIMRGIASKPVREYKDKQEGVIISGMTVDKRSNSGVASLTRVKDGRIMISTPRYMYAKDQKPEDRIQSNILPEFLAGFASRFTHKGQ